MGPRLARLVATSAASVASCACVGAAALLETGRAIHRLIGAWLKRHAGDIATTCADRLVHLAWGPRRGALITTAGGIRASLTLGTPCSAAIRAPSRLAESAAGIKILLAGGKGETLATVAAGQSHVARHLVDGSLRTNKNVRSAQLARARSPVGWVWVPSTRGLFPDEEQCQPPQFSGSLRRRASAYLGKKPLGVTTLCKRGRPHCRGDLLLDLVVGDVISRHALSDG